MSSKVEAHVAETTGHLLHMDYLNQHHLLLLYNEAIRGDIHVHIGL
jgi:hypothetical protein